MNGLRTQNNNVVRALQYTTTKRGGSPQQSMTYHDLDTPPRVIGNGGNEKGKKETETETLEMVVVIM